MLPEFIGPSRVFNVLQEETRLLILDTRPKSAYLKGHIRHATCVELTPSGRTLIETSGPGPPIWTKNCWWDKNILLVVSESVEKAVLLKRQLESDLKRGRETKLVNKEGDRRSKWENDDADEAEEEERGGGKKLKVEGLEVDPVAAFLLKETLVRTLRVLVSSEDFNPREEGGGKGGGGFSEFAAAYPTLITRHTKKGPAIPRYPTEVVPGLLYLGDLEHAKAVSRLRELSITHLITAHTEELRLGSTAEEESFVRLFCDLSDEFDSDISRHFESCQDFIQTAKEQGGRVLLHCGAGASRSATLCAAYLMKEKGWRAEKAVSFLKQQRSKVNPNPGFMKALEAYEKRLAEEKKTQERARESEEGRKESRSTNGARHEVHRSAPSRPVVPSSTMPTLSSTGLRLEVMKDGDVVATIPLVGKSHFVIGRLPTCDIVLDHASISRQHARLTIPTGGAEPFLECLGAAHGTRVDGRTLRSSKGTSSGEKCLVQDGSRIQFGASTRVYMLRGLSASTSSTQWEGEADD
eukprot:TRINITY_DN23659_c0_g1_i1.p1 TRINITY_DN23659_c0_g1~~TRINITY_DN23659_c0_g1_i1.p1  ORF type:complete len:523 (-),score=95.18 TRINITY_DN23659_c0_g1_i1:406-1974(-)